MARIVVKSECEEVLGIKAKVLRAVSSLLNRLVCPQIDSVLKLKWNGSWIELELD